MCGSSDLSDPAVKKKCGELFREWSQYASVPGLERVARLYKVLFAVQLPEYLTDGI